jgi:GntR family transcriptional regulator
MIVFRIDTRSAIPPYLQIVQQVKHALRLGMIDPGDQLPTIKQVVADVAINPNTVLKAYRELELEGLAEGRPGVGTFLVGTLAGPSLDNQAELREELVAWLERARAAGLSADDVRALIETTMRNTPEVRA